MNGETNLISAAAYMHPQAFVDDGCQVADGATVWQFASVVRDAVVGAGTSIGANATIDGAVIGSRCRIQSGARLYPGATLEHEVFVGPNVVICNDAWPRVDKTGFYLVKYRDRVSVRIKHGAAIGAGAIVLPGVTVGVNAMIAAGAVVDRDVPDRHILSRDGRLIRDDGRRVQRMRFADE